MAYSPTQILSKTITMNLKLQHSNSLLFLPTTNLNHNKYKYNLITSPKCTTTTSSPSKPEPESPDPFPTPEISTTTPAELFPLEKRRPSEITRTRKPRNLVKPEPPNFQIGWKRTKPINLEKPTGYVIMDFLEKLEGLMGLQFGSTELLAKTGEIVAERAREEAEILLEEGKVEGRMVVELSRVLKLMEMDLIMLKSAVKDETVEKRLEQAKARCRQAILVANSF